MNDPEINNSSTFHEDLARLTAKIKSSSMYKPEYEPKLGDVLQKLGREKKLLQRMKDNNFDINEVHELSDVARDYLNALQVEKLYTCRMCYHKNHKYKCDFHKKYIDVNMVSVQHDEKYIRFLNSEMGPISFMELYYVFLSLPQWRLTAQFLMRDLTGCSSVQELLITNECRNSHDVDIVEYTMEHDDNDEDLNE
ncbi:hypothetical protein [Rachiplusia nu nucleopolyhedrovirus]|uniref:Uncharacterized protein n=1 Tax=Rachiplusia nu nucleopolyhedrovirus TaxID=2605775 RepID=A0AAE6IRD1_9ABAC|nr:hypothetical protein QKQ55_gp025 [Rachiplusia nu nucleopolyhedrovirus]QEI03649.1 hypothetical protein [Rachiplusia nu nucleopolyhedrovirus]